MVETYDFNDKENGQIYRKECKCKQVIEISTQKDDFPEYYTTIFVKCPKCGESIEFLLPVN